MSVARGQRRLRVEFPGQPVDEPGTDELVLSIGQLAQETGEPGGMPIGRLEAMLGDVGDEGPAPVGQWVSGTVECSSGNAA
ncbi:hypothetical protein GCM10009646_14510 [Streptomyces aureus]